MVSGKEKKSTEKDDKSTVRASEVEVQSQKSREAPARTTSSGSSGS